MYDAEDKILWSKPHFVHHQIKLSHDGQRILTLLFELKGDYREDIFAVMDLEGKILHRAKALDLFKDRLQFGLNELSPWEKERFNAKYEMSHFNSIDEIPKNSSKLPFLKEGNIIVNSAGHGTCILSRDLKIVHDCRKIPETNTLHDVQITADGKYLYFNNEVFDKSGLHSSAVEEFDPVTKKRKVLFAAEPKAAFYSPNCGGVQIFKDLLIVSHVTTGAYVIDRKTGKISDYIPNLETRKDQEIKVMDLNSFLKTRKLKN